MDIRILWFFSKKKIIDISLIYDFSKILPFMSSDRKPISPPKICLGPLCQIIVFNAEPIRPQPWTFLFLFCDDPKVCADPSWLLVFKNGIIKCSKKWLGNWLFEVDVKNMTEKEKDLYLYTIVKISLDLLYPPLRQLCRFRLVKWDFLSSQINLQIGPPVLYSTPIYKMFFRGIPPTTAEFPPRTVLCIQN